MVRNRFVPSICAAVIVAALAAAPAVMAGGAADEFVPDQLVCRTLTTQAINDINDQYGTSIISFMPLGLSYLLSTAPGTDVTALAAQIALDPDVVYCEPNFLLDAPEPVQSSQAFLDQQHVGSFNDQLAAQTLQLTSAQTTATGQSVSVAVVDAGVATDHPVFNGMAVSGFDYVDGDSVATDPGGLATGHGTFIAGVVSLVAPQSQTRAYRVIDTTGSGNGFAVAEAVLQAVADGCKVINLSLVMQDKHSTLDEAIDFAHANNVLVVAAAGNDGSETERFPARDSYTLAVAGLDSVNLKADFSNWNGKVDVCAPATRVYAPYIDTSYAWWDGTSFAAPFVAGLAALLWEIRPEATVAEIRDAILLTADNVDSINPAYADGLGAGLIDPVAAIAYITSLGGVCGDVTGDGSSNVGDLTYLVDYLFRGGPAPDPLVGNVDGTGNLNVGDVTYFVNFLFRGGPALVCGP